jgi:hypothetical protein
MNHTLLLPLLLAGAANWLHAAPTTRAADFTAALDQAKPAGNDIVVFQRGSDWNRLGETLYQNVWLRPEFVSALGDGFVLVAVDRPEQAGAPALGSGGDPAAIKRFSAATAPEAPLPACQITALHTAGGAPFKQRADGAWLVDDPQGAKNPATEVIEITLQARAGGQLLRLDFLPDAALPNGCAGRASNGNFAISEIEVSQAGKPVAIRQCWGSHFEANMPPAQLIDGLKDVSNNGWNAAAHHRQPRTVMLTFAGPARAGTPLKVVLTCKSQWAQHVPACLRAALLDDPPLASSVEAVVAAQALAAANASFTWWDGNRCPRVALVDSGGRAIAALDTPRSDLTPATLAARVKELRDQRIRRDELLAKAEKAQGPEQAELLRQALDVLGIANWPGNGNCYKAIHDRIKAADPQDLSGAVRWLGFSADPKGGVPWSKPAWNETLDTQGGKRTLADADYQEALARIDKELADPRNRILSHENIQRMMVAKFHVFRSWKGREDERFRIQQEIAAFDPTTFWGIGARGYLGMYGRSETPYLSYGWKPTQVKSGLNAWRMTDTGDFFDHPGSYKVALIHSGGTATVKVQRLALLAGDSILAEARPDAELGPGPKARVEAILDCAGWQPGMDPVFVAEIEAAADQADTAGRFAIEPWLSEPSATASGAPTDYHKVFRDLRDALSATLSPHRDALDKPLAADATRLDLARYELLRRCGPDTLNQLATRPGGAGFLQAFTGDLAWLESFLANDAAPWPQALENLRLLHHHARDLNVPLYRTLATAMALAAGELNRHRLLERFADIVKTHREGLLHVSFDSLDTREMRWAVPLAGTAADFRAMVDAMQVRLGEYLGACWGIPYIDPNVYGYSVQGWGYADPWTHHYGTGTGDRPFRAQRLVGGVCGTLSGFGATVSKAHGIMATTVGQPGHCAYVVRIGQEWPTGNDVSGPETNGASVFEGTGFPTMHRLYEPMHAAKAAFLRSSRLAWAAHLFLDRRAAQVSVLPGWDADWAGAYQQAIAALPIHYPLALEYIKALEAVPDVPAAVWRKLCGEIATAYAPYHEAAWALVNRCFARLAPAMKPAERVALLVQCHQRIKQSNAPKFFGYNLAGVLNGQADSLGDPALAVTFMQKLLEIHFAPDPATNRVFGDVLNWGRARFAADPATAAAYAKAIGSFFASKGDAVGANQMRDQISAGIRKAGETGDPAAWKLWSDMATRFLPPLQPGDVHLNAEQAKAAPKFTPPAGVLLSRDGLLQTSSACQFDRPLSYRAVLDGSAPGWFDTNAEAQPWAQVMLAGEAEITGVVAINRYEYTPEQEEFQWAAPSKVLVSPDGKTWTEIGTIGKAEATMRVDLTGKPVRARFVRIERQAPADQAKPAGRLHLRNFLVYGRKLY